MAAHAAAASAPSREAAVTVAVLTAAVDAVAAVLTVAAVDAVAAGCAAAVDAAAAGAAAVGGNFAVRIR